MKRLHSGYAKPPRTIVYRPTPSSDNLSISNIDFTPTTVSRSFRGRVAEHLPGLGNNKAYWRLLQYLIFGTWRDVDNQYLLLPRQLLAAMENAACDSHYSGIKFVKSFIEHVGVRIELEGSVFTYDPYLCRSRSVRAVHLSDPVKALVTAERSSSDEDRVWMDTGHKWRREHGTALRNRDHETAEHIMATNRHCPETVALCEYLNSLPPHRFSSAMRHLPAAMDAASGLNDADNQLNILRAIRDQSQPFYSPVEKSVRAFAVRDSILRLHRDLRKILTQDWITADLRSAQLAIVAKVWDVPEIASYLESGRSIWADLCEHMGIPFNSDNKAIVKTPLYSITFGAGKKKMHAIFGRSFHSGRGAYDRFKTHPVVRALLRARSRQLRVIRQAKGGTDAFGRFLELTKRHKEGYNYEFDNSRSILACIAQSYELKLLMPAIQLAIAERFNEHGFAITTFLHDGFTFDAFRREEDQYWQDRLGALVAAEADNLGILTELEFSAY